MKQKHLALGAIGIIGVLAAIFILPGMLSAQGREPSESGLAAAISFRPTNTASVASYQLPSADVLNRFSFLSAVPTLAVTSGGQTVDDTAMVVQIKGKVITAGVPVQDWSVTGNLKVRVDSSDFKSYPLNAAGTGSIPDPIIVNINSANEALIPVSDLEQKWGVFNYGEHTVTLIADAVMTVNFEDGEKFTKTFTSQNIGSVKFNSKSDATVESVELSSNYGSAGTTEETDTQEEQQDENENGDTTTTDPPQQVTYVTDTWATFVGTNYINVDRNKMGMFISDSNRYNKELISSTFYLTAENGGGSLVARLWDSSGSVVLASSTNTLDSVTTDGNYKFTFPDGTMTPSANFRIGLECINCSNDPIARMGNTGVTGSQYDDGYMVYTRSGGSTWTDDKGRDAAGSAKYLN